MEPLYWTDYLIRLGLAFLLCGLLGIDRENKNHPAGLRTLILVGVGTAVFVLSGYSLASGFESDEARAQAIRTIQGVATGIGFLGAGTILKQGTDVYGMTTAATVWAACAIGVACAFGRFELALLATGFSVFTLTVLRWVEKGVFEQAEAKRGVEKNTEAAE